MKKSLIVLLVLCNIGYGQISKNMVRKHIDEKAYIEIIDSHFILTKVENTGAMLGYGENLPPILKIIFLQAIPIIVLLILLFRILNTEDMIKWLVLAFACLIGGGIGNLIDYMAHGPVTDFFLIKFGFLKTGIFNMADVPVSLGVLPLLFLSIRIKIFEI